MQYQVHAVIKPEYVCLVEGYLKEREWPHACTVVKPWHDYLGQQGRYQLIDAYIYFDDYPYQGYTREEFSSRDRTLILTGPADDTSFDIASMVELLLRPMSESLNFSITPLTQPGS